MVNRPDRKDWAQRAVAEYLSEDEQNIPVDSLPDNAQAVIRQLTQQLSEGIPTPPNVTLAKSRLLAAMGEPSSTTPINDLGKTSQKCSGVTPAISGFPLATRYMLAGAILSAFLLVAGWSSGWYSGARHVNTQLVEQVSSYTTANGQRATITLPDGSTALLNVGSRLTVPTGYGVSSRTVQLSGEALFTVAPRAGTPFTVVAGPSTTRVLGTRFVVRHYATDTAASIVVRDGKVAVGSVVLSANQQTLVSDRSTGAVLPADPARFGFASGVLTFNSVSLPDAIQELERWYDVEIRIGDAALAERRVTGQCATGSVAELTEILELALGARVTREGRILTLYSRG